MLIFGWRYYDDNTIVLYKNDKIGGNENGKICM